MGNTSHGLQYRRRVRGSSSASYQQAVQWEGLSLFYDSEERLEFSPRLVL